MGQEEGQEASKMRAPKHLRSGDRSWREGCYVSHLGRFLNKLTFKLHSQGFYWSEVGPGHLYVFKCPWGFLCATRPEDHWCRQQLVLLALHWRHSR